MPDLKLKLVYIAGPYRADTENGVHENIEAARKVAVEVWKLGAVAVCPQLNSAYMCGVVPVERFLEGGLELVRRCDAVMLLRGWRGSIGSQSEFNLSVRLRIPQFDEGDLRNGALKRWIDA